MIDAFMSPGTVVEDMVRLHGGNDTFRRKAGYGRPRKMLGMLDAAPPVLLTVFFSDECKFIQDPVICAIANGMDRMLDIGFIRFPQNMLEIRGVIKSNDTHSGKVFFLWG